MIAQTYISRGINECCEGMAWQREANRAAECMDIDLAIQALEVAITCSRRASAYLAQGTNESRLTRAKSRRPTQKELQYQHPPPAASPSNQHRNCPASRGELPAGLSVPSAQEKPLDTPIL